jgi:uncharacterized protein
MLVIPILLALAVIGVSRWARGRYVSKMALGQRTHAPEDCTGAEIAAEFLRAHGAEDVQIIAHEGVITNYFDPGRRRLFLNREVREGRTLAAWAQALHEAAHALQIGDDKDALLWRRTCIRLTRYVPMFALMGTAAATFFLKIPFRHSLIALVAICVLIMVLNLGTLAVEHNANARLRRWLEERLSSSPTALERLEVLLSAAALREVGDFIQAPRFFFFTALPGTSGPRPG